MAGQARLLLCLQCCHKHFGQVFKYFTKYQGRNKYSQQIQFKHKFLDTGHDYLVTYLIFQKKKSSATYAELLL